MTKSVFYGVSGEFCTGIAAGGAVLDEFLSQVLADRGVLGDLFLDSSRRICRANLVPRRRLRPPLDVGHAHTLEVFEWVSP